MSETWVPLEASPDWAHSLGLPQALTFQDLLSLEPDFLSYVPQPVQAVLLLFPNPPGGDSLHATRLKEAHDAPPWKGEDVWWVRQTIPNACGSMSLLHALLNLPDGVLELDSALVKFKQDSLSLDPAARQKLLEEADFFREAHTAATTAGQSAIPEDLNVDGHFLAFVEARNTEGEMRVIELDGATRIGPFDQGPCTSLLHDGAAIVRDRYIAQAGEDIRFTLLVLAPAVESNM
ncbi:uncharacterized protein MKK02DRAFT_40094 [Dioszegia hungarica]|uniref:Ubiquitin carboxyl-terminal hydrolase n=1 Tax=Dioszegia hungarica TaxID=4972 RepID=A0AA38HHU2_9TREE|nr:uncharacterized protein MKK02DRAFT_40094 [Dioszegia hungarica]KAI9639769.1 hypothetical protein MKK02DRAFT_40094 [Dioszegia hungarica]